MAVLGARLGQRSTSYGGGDVDPMYYNSGGVRGSSGTAILFRWWWGCGFDVLQQRRFSGLFLVEVYGDGHRRTRDGNTGARVCSISFIFVIHLMSSVVMGSSSKI